MKVVQQKVNFVDQILTLIDNDGFDLSYIWFRDEANFHLNGIVNKQNWRIRGSVNAHLCEEKALYTPKVTERAAVCAKSIIGPFSVRETITTECKVTVLEKCVSIQLPLENRPGTDWSMQDPM